MCPKIFGDTRSYVDISSRRCLYPPVLCCFCKDRNDLMLFNSFYVILKETTLCREYTTNCNIYQISSMMIIIIIIKMGLAMQGREREIATRSVRRPRPHSSVGVNESVSILRGEMTQVFLVLKFK